VSSKSLERSFEATIEHLARRWMGARPLLPAFALLSRGEPLEVSEIAAATGTGIERIEEALASARCTRDGGGRVIDLFGMTLTPTQHRLDIGPATTFGCCALWAHTIPRLVGLTARVESEDPMSGEPVHLSISPNGLESVETHGAVAVLAVAEPQAIETNVAAAFCSHVRHFASRETAMRFAAVAPSRHVVELAQLDEAARSLHGAILSASAS
jgi:alkylmercury lyase